MNEGEYLDSLCIMIKRTSKEIDKNYNRFKSNLEKLIKHKEEIKYNKGDNFDDFKFYLAFINNSHFYYKKSCEVRYNKLLKDFKKHCELINIEDFLGFNLMFNEDLAKTAFDNYLLKVQINREKHTRTQNTYYWMKDNKLDVLKDWPLDLYEILNFHNQIIIILLAALDIELNFICLRKEIIRSNSYEINTSQSNYLQEILQSVFRNADIDSSVLTELTDDDDNENGDDYKIYQEQTDKLQDTIKNLNCKIQDNENFKVSLNKKLLDNNSLLSNKNKECSGLNCNIKSLEESLSKIKNINNNIENKVNKVLDDKKIKREDLDLLQKIDELIKLVK